MDLGIHRRHFLAVSAAALARASLAPLHAAGRVRLSPALPGAAAPRTLVVLQLAGGNDGLSTVVPFADDAYHRARPSIAIPADKVRRIDDYHGFNPALERLHAHFEAGRLALVEGAGYPEPVRSHFKSFDVWHAADARGRGVPEGWLGRLARALIAGAVNPNATVHVGPSVPYSLHSATQPPVSFVTPTGYRWAGSESERMAFEEAARRDTVGDEPAPQRGRPSKEGSNLEFLRQVLLDGQSSSAAIRRAAAAYRTPVDYPTDAFGSALRDVAALIHGDVASRILSVELGGFDTHTDLTNRHARLMTTLDAGLGAFLDDLARSEAGREAVVLVFSEFGRRVAENGSKGLDHGTAGPMLVAGARVRGGLFGQHPSLTDLDNGDLVFGTDFRRVYASLIEGWFGVPNARVLGSRYEPLELFGA